MAAPGKIARQSKRRSTRKKTVRRAAGGTTRAPKAAARKPGRRPTKASVPGQFDYTKVCFVIMPFGTKPVGKHRVNFDRIYEKIFQPAINAVELPEGGKLVAHRTDKDFFAGDIGQEMFEYIQWSRFALADITSLNPNVMYEIGVRHAARESGTAIFRQSNAAIPFDINHIKAFPYDYRPEENATAARALIRRVLRESLLQNRLDSPVQIALRAQRNIPALEPLLMEAETRIREFNRPGAIAKLREAITMTGGNALLHQRLGLLFRDQGDLTQALAHFDAAVALQPDYSEAWREKGIMQGKLSKAPNPDAEAAIGKAIELNPNDFDALASMGGLLRKAGRYADALAMYRRAVDVSGGHPYPLLMALKLQARAQRVLEIAEVQRRHLRQAELMRRAQAETKPPLDSPWCFFDMAELRLYDGDAVGFVEWLKRGLANCDHRWQAETFRSALQLLVDGGVKPDGLSAGITGLDAAILRLP